MNFLTKQQLPASLSEVHETVDTSKTKGLRRFLAFAGPAYLVSVGYMDPGNWATDLQGGAQFGYKLIWVLLMSNLMALLLQSLSARLGIVRRRDLAQANREEYSPLVNFCLYILAELAIAACDLAEVLGMAIGLHLLTGISILAAVLITVLDTLLLLWLQQLGIRRLEAFIIGLVLVIGVSFLIEMFFAKPDLGEVMKGFIPTSLDNGALYIAVGIIGATVMPHNLYLHSALVQTRRIKPDASSVKKAIKYNTIDSAIALNAAFFVNAAILILAGAVFYTSGQVVTKIEDAHRLLDDLVGTAAAPFLFAIALIASGQSSTVTGTLAGQVVMEGYLQLRINPWMRRLLTRLIAIIPAVITILIYGDSKLDDLLVLSQVILSLQLGFAIIPLIHFVSDKATMGEFAIKPVTKVIAWIVAGILVSLNVKLVAEQSLEVFAGDGQIILKGIIIIAWLVFAWLFFTMTLFPLFKKRRMQKAAHIHSEEKPILNYAVPEISAIAIALDFSANDDKVIAYAVKEGGQAASYTLIHVVETVSARYLKESTDDFETRNDEQRLELYAAQLKANGYNAHIHLGFGNRVNEIVRIVKEQHAGMLILGAHRHTGLKDYLFGETVEHVRHKLKIPVLIVN
ncbi:MAG TPA: Nramp family divalent metal transporter [Chitinophagaceae bacterium]|nr:Nramp family divalent metal transporter [Chitinophagaceae bacterium]